jgi:hypothetical protein
LSRYRAGIDPAPEIVAESVSLRRGQTITFAPQWLPGRGAAPFDLVVNLARIDIGPDATLAVYLDGRELSVQTLGGPRSQHWQSEPVRVRPDDIVGRFSLELRGPDDTRGSVLVRDIGLFAADSTVGTAPSPDARIE